ncbi:MAG: tRNA (cytidine(34)-2'-O)-methyltransferase [Defluviitaleaceae bacterium]|nr:tRNA (cytidine(34)-2'-O)-methyltransferase [Defluviitaleaceae bacterium]
MNIVLHQPEIPHNTGAIGRTCLMTGTALHLIHPLGFLLDEKSLKRSGLDYWHKINIREYDGFTHFIDENPDAQFYLVETGSEKRYTDVSYTANDYLIFGSETCGLPSKMLADHADRIITIPMIGAERSLNLSVSVGIVLYEALRQTRFFSSGES